MVFYLVCVCVCFFLNALNVDGFRALALTNNNAIITIKFDTQRKLHHNSRWLRCYVHNPNDFSRWAYSQVIVIFCCAVILAHTKKNH